MSEEYIPLPPQARPASQLGESADTPKLDTLVGETVCIKALDWIGERPPYMGVRLRLHIVKGDKMSKSAEWYRAYTAAVLRVAAQLAAGDKERTVMLDQWPIYKVIASGNSYALTDV